MKVICDGCKKPFKFDSRDAASVSMYIMWLDRATQKYVGECYPCARDRRTADHLLNTNWPHTWDGEWIDDTR